MNSFMNSHLLISRFFSMVCLALLQQHVFAGMPDCEKKLSGAFDQKVCSHQELKDLNQQIREKYLNAQLMSNAPLKLLETSNRAWEKYVKSCKSVQCIHREFEQRIDDLTFFTTINQSLTQHYIRYKSAAIDSQMTHIQLQQLDKNRIKIEGIQYRSPNNSEATRIAYLRSYSSPDHLTDITDLENKCIYSLIRTDHTLEFQSEDPKCQRFVGLYKLYD